MTASAMHAYLAASPTIDCDHRAIVLQAHALAPGSTDAADIAQACFEFVRDQILHSADAQRGPITCKASDVLRHRTGFCYAKSHLLAALLRARGIPAGLCYQRVRSHTQATAWCLHGLNAVYLPAHGWLRVDARGNKPGVNAQWNPPHEALAFTLHHPEERDLPEIWAEPLPVVLQALQHHRTVSDLLEGLPDVPLLAMHGATPSAPPMPAHR